MKVIKVDCCGVCPLVEVRYPTKTLKEYYCTHQKTNGMEIENPNFIDLYCPLEDYKKGES